MVKNLLNHLQNGLTELKFVLILKIGFKTN